MRAQSQYRNLHHISFWEMSIAYLALWDVKSSLSCWSTLEKEATVSKIPELGGAGVTDYLLLLFVFSVVKIDLFIWNGSLFVGHG